MSASATETLTLPAEAAVINLKPVESTTLVIGSLSTAQDGQYQAIISNASDSSRVERQMVDRLLDGAAFLESDAYSSVYVALSQTEYDSLLPQLTSLFPRLLSSLAPAGQLYITNITSQLDAFTAELRLAGFIVKSTPETDRKTIAAQRPAYTNGTTQTLDTPMLSKYSGSSAPLKSSLSVPLRKFPLTLNRDRASQSSKKALWTLSSPSAATIDPDSLLTAEDRARPVPVCEPVTKGSGSGPRRRKACKNCTCGLAEELEAEAQNSLAVVLDGAVDGAVKEVVNGEFLNGKAKMLPKVTSSCGSCYLGDAFRCSSCPYLGLPAFKPGEKVEINLGMDDI